MLPHSRHGANTDGERQVSAEAFLQHGTHLGKGLDVVRPADRGNGLRTRR